MFSNSRKVAEALKALDETANDIRVVLAHLSFEGLQEVLAEIREALKANAQQSVLGGDLSDRMAAIEVGYAKISAEAEALVLKADAQFKNARNAEERTSHRKRQMDEAATEGSSESEAFEEAMSRWAQDQDAERGEDNGLPAVHQNLEVYSSKTLAKRAKFR